MKKIRLIISSSENDDDEHVIFTEDLEQSADFFVNSDFTVDIDQIIEDVLPSGFPREYTLIRS